jgi:hypothetical protein
MPHDIHVQIQDTRRLLEADFEFVSSDSSVWSDDSLPMFLLSMATWVLAPSSERISASPRERPLQEKAKRVFDNVSRKKSAHAYQRRPVVLRLSQWSAIGLPPRYRNNKMYNIL